jgi:hypothetical protein
MEPIRLPPHTDGRLRMYQQVAPQAGLVDVAVVEGAIRRGDGVVTSDARHIRKIAAAARSTLRIESI